MPEDQDLGFKVSDRRLFNPDGTPRVLEEEPAPSAPASAPSSAAPPPAAPSPFAPAMEAGAAFGGGQDVPPGEREEDEMTEFMAAVMNVASPAFIYLGLAEHPATGRPQVDLVAAQQYIDILAVLREKTKGNLTRNEEEFFDGLLADMRMQFVALKNQGLGARG
jgi:hypothetical protein